MEEGTREGPGEENQSRREQSQPRPATWGTCRLCCSGGSPRSGEILRVSGARVPEREPGWEGGGRSRRSGEGRCTFRNSGAGFRSSRTYCSPPSAPGLPERELGSEIVDTISPSQAHLFLSSLSLFCSPARSLGSSDLHSLPASPRFFPLRCLQISSFANSSWTRTDGLGWVGELQAYTWRNDSDTIVFLKPWSQGTLSDQLANQLQHIFKGYRSSFTRDIREFVKMLGSDCELRDGTVGSCPGGGGGRRSPTGRSWCYLLRALPLSLPISTSV